MVHQIIGEKCICKMEKNAKTYRLLEGIKRQDVSTRSKILQNIAEVCWVLQFGLVVIFKIKNVQFYRELGNATSAFNFNKTFPTSCHKRQTHAPKIGTDQC